VGNRATVIFEDQAHEKFSPAIYLHWNGGPESVYPLLKELDRRGVRADQNYEAARFVAIVAEFFDVKEYTSLSLGVANGPKSDSLKALAPFNPGDNGIYLVCRQSKTQVRRFLGEQEMRQGKTRVRRFLEGQEMPRKAVLAEEREAWTHEYNVKATTILDHFDKKKPIGQC